MRSPTPPTGPDGAAITNTAPGPATTPATASDFHDQRSTTAVLRLLGRADCRRYFEYRQRKRFLLAETGQRRQQLSPILAAVKSMASSNWPGHPDIRGADGPVAVEQLRPVEIGD